MYLNNQCDNTCYHDDKGKEVTISHVHKHHPFRKTRNGIESRLFGCLGEYIILRTPTVGAGAGFCLFKQTFLN